MKKRPLHIRVAEHLDERKKEIDEIGYNAHYEMDRLSNTLKKKEDVTALKRAAELLAKPLGDSDPDMPSMSYVEHNLASGRLLAELASHENAGVRKSAVDAISNYLPLYRDKQLVDAVNRALIDEDESVRQSALNAKKIIDEHKEVWKDLDEIKGPLNRLADALIKSGVPITEGFVQNNNAQKIIIDYGGKRYLPDGFTQTVHTLPLLRLLAIPSAKEQFMASIIKNGGVLLPDIQSIKSMRIPPFHDSLISQKVFYEDPKLVRDAVTVAKKIIDMGLRNKIEDTPIGNYTGNAISLLSLLAVHYRSKEALATLASLVGKEEKLLASMKKGGGSGTKRDLRSFFSMVGLYAKEEGMSEADKLLGKLSKQEIEDGRKMLEHQKEIEQKIKEYHDTIDRLIPLTDEELDRLVKAGDDGVREIIDGYDNGTRTIDDVFTVLRKSDSPLATNALLEAYDQSHRQETEELLKDMDRPLEERIEERKKEEENELFVWLASMFTGSPVPERKTMRRSIARMLVEKGTSEALKPLLDEVDLDDVSYKSLFDIAPEKADPLKRFLDKKGVSDTAKARVLYILGGKRDPEINDFIYERFKASKSAVVKQAATLALYEAGDPRVLECAREMLNSPDQELDKSVLTLTGTSPLNSNVHKLRQEDINTNHRFAAEIISAVATAALGDALFHPSKLTPIFKNHEEASRIAEKWKKLHPDEIVREIFAVPSKVFSIREERKAREEEKKEKRKEEANKDVQSIVDTYLRKDDYPAKNIYSDWSESFHEAYKELRHHVVSHTSHQYAAYVLGFRALNGNKLALEYLKRIRDYTDDEHAIKVADMVVKHIEGRKK